MCSLLTAKENLGFPNENSDTICLEKVVQIHILSHQHTEISPFVCFHNVNFTSLTLENG